jgi:hypothetical protein
MPLSKLTAKGPYDFSELYSGTSTTNPPFSFYVSVVVLAQDGSTTVDVGTTISLKAVSDFYSPAIIEDSLLVPSEAISSVNKKKVIYYKSEESEQISQFVPINYQEN